MPSAGNDISAFISRVRLVGRASGGTVKTLPGFKKGRHALPDAVNPATRAFFARLCEPMLREEAEGWFQRARMQLQTKRKDLALEVTGALAVLSGREFTFEIAYDLDEADPTAFVGSRTLHQVAAARLGEAEFETLFAGQFDEIAFDLKKGVQVEAVIDAVEDLDDPAILRVDYPSDCRDCTLTVPGVEAEVVCDGGALTMRFPRQGGPMELVEAFLAVRHAFSLSRRRVLAGLL